MIILSKMMPLYAMFNCHILMPEHRNEIPTSTAGCKDQVEIYLDLCRDKLFFCFYSYVVMLLGIYEGTS